MPRPIPKPIPKPIPTPNELKKSLENLRNMGKPICKVCGVRLHGEYHYCPNCGNGMTKLFDKPSVKFALICVICGREIKDQFAKFCTNCGQKLRRKAEEIKKKE